MGPTDRPSDYGRSSECFAAMVFLAWLVDAPARFVAIATDGAGADQNTTTSSFTLELGKVTR